MLLKSTRTSTSSRCTKLLNYRENLVKSERIRPRNVHSFYFTVVDIIDQIVSTLHLSTRVLSELSTQRIERKKLYDLRDFYVRKMDTKKCHFSFSDEHVLWFFQRTRR